MYFKKEAAFEVLKQIEAQVEAGNLVKINERSSQNIDVTDGLNKYVCQIVQDAYKDKDGNLYYYAEHHIDSSKDYHWLLLQDFENGFL